MTYGLLNELCKVVGELDGASLMALDNTLREEILIQMLSPRDAEGVIHTRMSVFNLDASIDEVSGLLAWGQEHIMGFFMSAAETAMTTNLATVARMDVLKRSLPGGST